MENTDNKPAEPEVNEPVQELVKPVAKEDKVETPDKKESKADTSKNDDTKTTTSVAKTAATGKRGK